ncbi:MAG: tRNA (adenosine(37)-N6)-threonylcarbamoyltransferase complex transferase subunit TsaD [Bdellovibrionaceae bacterium]|nr:tRNA (adenosine(37)-N6)-threonylcarbamoyltransferase complex transferase subunit TsaD [Bdellovibrionales bacterium]MCB9254117.1 tRNA (adenosine(37)-N6)-threonylcarbamoyltransferase complex transferase subunit TsaD [Pseudobdellovibrionaceae bacterium]
MKILAVDTSCDESCVAIVDTESWSLLADVVHSHIDAMKRFGGVVPEVASREHLKALPLAVEQALETANCALSDIDWFAVSDRPGLIGALLVGVSYVKAAAYALGKPYTGLNHIEAHLYSPMLATFEGGETPPFPWIALVVSGGHTELFHVKSESEYEWLGGTLDDAAGEAYDKIGKVLGLGYPAGPKLDRLVREMATDEDRRRFAFPVARTGAYDFSFSGLKTAVALETAKEELTDSRRLRIAASAQEAILEALCVKVREASSKLGVPQIVVTGGVACNSRFRVLLSEAYFPMPRHCTDNAAMVAALAAVHLRAGKLVPSPWTQTPSPRAELAPTVS